MCLDHSAHGVVSTHEVFQRPYRIAFEWETTPTPGNYKRFYDGRALGDTIRTWRVQEGGYTDDPKMQAGVVAGAWGFADSPDAEFIASGLNTKGPKYVALGRHGPFFQWGFYASPSDMTAAGRQAFVNAVCYIRRFDRQAPLTRKRTTHRGYVLDSALVLEQLEEQYAALRATYQKREADRALAEAVQKSGERPLTVREKTLLNLPMSKAPTLEAYTKMFFRGHPAEVVERFGTSPAGRAKYLPFYEKNLPYLYREGRDLEVDADAKAWGIDNRNTEVLRHAVGLLEKGEDVERARRVLRRYTDQTFDAAADWRRWLDAEGADLFFSDVGGFRFYSSRPAPEVLRSQVLARPGEAPTGARPVVCEAFLLGTPVRGATVTIGIRMRHAEGWHTYAMAPPRSPYPVNRMELTLPAGAEAVGGWDEPGAMPYLANPSMMIFEGEVVYLHRVRLTAAPGAGAKAIIRASWQTCDAHKCLPPDSVRLEVPLGRRP